MGVVLEDGTCFVVLTEVNGYRNIYGHVLFSKVEDANEAKRKAEESGCWDNVFVTRWDVV